MAPAAAGPEHMSRGWQAVSDGSSMSSSPLRRGARRHGGSAGGSCTVSGVDGGDGGADGGPCTYSAYLTAACIGVLQAEAICTRLGLVTTAW